MAFSPTETASAYSLWLQLRSTKRKRRPHWRSDWTPVWVSLLLLCILVFVYSMLPLDDAAEQIEQTAHKEALLQERPIQDALAP